MLQRIERVMQHILKPALLIAPLTGLALWQLTQESGHPVERVIGSVIVALAYGMIPDASQLFGALIVSQTNQSTRDASTPSNLARKHKTSRPDVLI